MVDEVENLSYEEVRSLVATYKERYDDTRKYALQMEQKYTRSVTREKRIVLDHQKQVLQAETLNMMTKYQLVFAKIECQVNRVLNSNKIRELKLQQRVFDRMRNDAQACQVRQNYHAHLINLRLQGNVGVQMLNRYQTNRLRSLKRAFESWRLASDAAKVIERIQCTIKSELRNAHSINEKLVKTLKLKQAELEAELVSQQEVYKQQESVRQSITEAEQKLAQDQNLVRSRLSERSQEVGQAGEVNQQDLALLTEKEELYERLMTENKKLKANLSACEGNLQGYIAEMNSLLDQHQLGSLLGAALMPQEPELMAMGSQRTNPQAQRTQQHQDLTSNEEQLYSSQHDSINERQPQRNHLGETGGDQTITRI